MGQRRGPKDGRGERFRMALFVFLFFDVSQTGCIPRASGQPVHVVATCPVAEPVTEPYPSYSCITPAVREPGGSGVHDGAETADIPL